MTHKEIYERFLIEYDKQDVTSSFPSLTDTEIVALLNKAYLALIAQKVSGNNPRKAGFESDIKSIEDIRPLVITSYARESDPVDFVPNCEAYQIPGKMLYFVQARHGNKNVQLVTHSIAEGFMVTATNRPWIKTPVCYLEGSCIHVLVDPTEIEEGKQKTLSITYVKKPVPFTTNSINKTGEQTPTVTYKYNAPSSFQKTIPWDQTYYYIQIKGEIEVYIDGILDEYVEDVIVEKVVFDSKNDTNHTEIKSGTITWNGEQIKYTITQNTKPTDDQ